MDNTQASLQLSPSPAPSLVVREHTRALPGWLSRTIAAVEIVFVCGIPTQLLVAIGLIFFVQMPIMVDDHLSLEFLALVSLLDTALIAMLMRGFLERSGETSRSVFLGVRSTRTEIWRGLKFVPVVFAAVTAVVLTLRWLVPSLHTVKESPFQAYFASPLETGIILAVVVLAGGVREELQRAFILHRCGQHFGAMGFNVRLLGRQLFRVNFPTDGRMIGLMLYSPLFAILHYDQGLDVVVAVGLLGLFWGVTYIKRRSAVTGMVNHACFNAAQVLQAALAKSFGM